MSVRLHHGGQGTRLVARRRPQSGRPLVPIDRERPLDRRAWS